MKKATVIDGYGREKETMTHTEVSPEEGNYHLP